MTYESTMSTSIETIRRNTSLASEVLSSLSKNNSDEANALLDLAITGLNHLHRGKNGKVRLENQYAYFDADYLDSKVWVNIRLKQEFWHTVLNLQELYKTLLDMGYSEKNKIENIVFDNRLHLFIPFQKPGFTITMPGTS